MTFRVDKASIGVKESPTPGNLLLNKLGANVWEAFDWNALTSIAAPHSQFFTWTGQIFPLSMCMIAHKIGGSFNTRRIIGCTLIIDHQFWIEINSLEYVSFLEGLRLILIDLD